MTEGRKVGQQLRLRRFTIKKISMHYFRIDLRLIKY